MLRRVLVANRGEIAVRVIRACFDEGLESVAALSEADLDSLPARLADRTVGIGPAAATESYLAEACAAHGIAFVGPTADTLRRGGDQVAARALARSLGIPVGAGSDSAATAEDAEAIADGVGYPVLLKAAAGGGGRGMALIRTPAELRAAFDRTSLEAAQAFGDGRLYVERFVEHARHVEVQVLADRHGNVVHLGERDCSCQRRHQKLVEEAPSPAVAPELRRGLRSRSRRRWATRAQAPSSFSWTSTGGHSRSWRSTPACRSSTRSPRWSPASTSCASSCGSRAGRSCRCGRAT
jgi:acetyl-CoA carboxylase biotin carboxylase subunit